MCEWSQRVMVNAFVVVRVEVVATVVGEVDGSCVVRDGCCVSYVCVVSTGAIITEMGQTEQGSMWQAWDGRRRYQVIEK